MIWLYVTISYHPVIKRRLAWRVSWDSSLLGDRSISTSGSECWLTDPCHSQEAVVQTHSIALSLQLPPSPFDKMASKWFKDVQSKLIAGLGICGELDKQMPGELPATSSLRHVPGTWSFDRSMPAMSSKRVAIALEPATFWASQIKSLKQRVDGLHQTTQPTTTTKKQTNWDYKDVFSYCHPANRCFETKWTQL